MLLSVRFAESPFPRRPQRKAIDVIHALTHGLQPASLCLTSPASAAKKRVQDFSSDTSTVTSSKAGGPSHTHSGAGSAQSWGETPQGRKTQAF